MLLSLPRKQLDSGLKIKLNRKRLHETVSVENLETQIDKRLTWKQGIIYVVLKLNKASVYCQNWDMYWTLKFGSQSMIQYLSPVYAILHLFVCKKTNSVKRPFLLQKKTFSSKLLLYFYCTFISKPLKDLLPTIFDSCFKFCVESPAVQMAWYVYFQATILNWLQTNSLW